jgi:hypothetical protein
MAKESTPLFKRCLLFYYIFSCFPNHSLPAHSWSQAEGLEKGHRVTLRAHDRMYIPI